MSRTNREKKPLLKCAYKAPNNVTINFCLVGDKYPVEKFIDDLSEGEQDEAIALFKLLGEKKGKIFNKQKFKMLCANECGNIFEFKAHQVRIACFTRPGYNYNLIYGFKKKTDAWPTHNLNAMEQNCRSFKKEEKRRE